MLLVAFGCSREPGKPVFDRPWNQDDIDIGRCVGACQVDLGPRPITQEECDRQEEGLEFFPAPVWDFETSRPDPDNLPEFYAALAYSYQDGTTEFLTVNDKSCTVEEATVGLSDQSSCQAQYEPTTTLVQRCGSQHAWHVRGGPFREWGGGIGRRLDDFALNAASAIGLTCPMIPSPNPDATVAPFCPKFEQRVADAPGHTFVKPATDTDPEKTSHYAMNEMAYYRMLADVRGWEGISFWARRGPDSQPGFRVGIQDRNLDDDISFQETSGGLVPHCRRAKECDCRNHRPCTPGPTGELFCWDPKLDVDHEATRHPWNHELYRCGVSACDYRYAAYPTQPDPPFWTSVRTLDGNVGTASCASFTFKNDITRMGCYDTTNGPTPAESADRCGDPWITPVRLSGDWAFYKIPFTELRQEGYGKEFPAIDLSAISSVRFTWGVGWLDVWIDDVRIYRRK